MMRVIGSMEARRARTQEQRLLSRLPHIVVSSTRERATLAGTDIHACLGDGGVYGATAGCHRRATIHVVPNGVDLDYFVPQTIERSPNTIIFSGRMSFHANVAAATLLVRQVMPLVWRLHPDVRVILAGSDPPRSVRALATDSRVSVTGYVEDLRPYIASATVAVSPTPYAVGVQNKVLEALAMGTPVVATPSSVAGLKGDAAYCLLVADEPSGIASALITLLHDTCKRAQLAKTGRDYVIRHHNWQAASRMLLEVYGMSLTDTTRSSSMASRFSLAGISQREHRTGV
jgi:glycosyltransferase involved in cell wall biosynthesis